NARYYDPALGRFISADTIVPDPANPQSLNRYAYVYNNPLKYTDPSGHAPDPPSEIPFSGIAYEEGDPRKLLFLGETFPYWQMYFDVGNTRVRFGSLVKEVDDYLWDKMDSTIGFYVQGSGSVGALIGGNISFGEMYLINWRSGETGTISGIGGEVGVYLGEETTASLDGGLATVKGTSSLEGCAGHDYTVSLSADTTALFGTGLDIGRSYSVDGAAILSEFTVDSFSGRRVVGNTLGSGVSIGQGAAVKLTGGTPGMNNSWVTRRNNLPHLVFSPIVDFMFE
ncbi:MAG: RHS repeat-associated core domain-containing protein, partial [Anaerolineales bacterium]